MDKFPKSFLQKILTLILLFLPISPSILFAALPVAEQDSKIQVSFQKDIRPVLKNNCLPCHNKTRSKGDVNLETPEDILKGNDDGPLVVPGKPEESYLFLVSAHIEEDSIMPPAKNKVSARNLSPKELGLMSLWIKQGAKADKKEEIKLEWQSVQTAIHDPIFAVALSPNGQFVATGRSNRVDVFHVPTGLHIDELSDSKLGDSNLYEKKPAHLDYVTSAAFSPNSQKIATGSFREVKIWELKESKAVKKGNFPAYSGKGSASTDGKWLAAVQGQDLSIIDLSSGNPVKKLSAGSEITATGFSLDGAFVVAGTASGKVQAWNAKDGSPAASATLADKPITTVGATVNPLRIISAHNDNILRVWEKPDEGAKDWKMARELKMHTKNVSQLLPHPKTANSIFTASEDGQIAQWDVASGKVLKKVSHGIAVVDLAINPAGDKFVSVGGKSAKLWGSDWKMITEMKGHVIKQNVYADAESAFAFANSEVKYRDAELKKSQDEHKKAQDRLKKAKEANEKAAKEPVEEKKAELEKNEAERDSIEKELKSLEEVLAKLQESTDASEAERKKAETAYKSVQNQLKTPQAKETQTQKTAATAKSAFDQKAKAAKSLEDSKLKPLESKIKDLNQKLAQAKAKVDQADKAFKDAGEDQAKKDAAKKQLDQSKAEFTNLEKQKQDQEKGLTAVQGQVKKAKDEESAAKKKYDDAQKSANAAKVAADKVRANIAAAKKKLDETTAEKNKHNSELSKIKKEKEAPLKKKFADLQKKIDADRKEFDKINGPLQTSIRELANSEQDLKRTEAELAKDQKLKEEQDAKLKTVTAARDKAKEAATSSELPISSVTFSNDGNFIFTSGEGQQIHSWSANTGVACLVYDSIPAAIEIVGSYPDGSVSFVAQNGDVFTQNLKPKFILEKKFGSALGESPIVSRVTSLDISPDGKVLAIGGGDPSRSGEIITYDLQAHKQLGKYEDIHSDTVLDLDFSPKGNHVASASSDKFVKVFEASTGKVTRSYEGHTHHVLGVSWRKTGREIVSSGADNDIKYWNVENGDRLGKGGGFKKEITSVHAIGIGNEAIVTSAEGKVSVVQLGSTIRKTADFSGAVKYTHVSDVTPDGRIVAAGSQDGVLRIWRVKDRKLLYELKPKVEVKDSLADNK